MVNWLLATKSPRPGAGADNGPIARGWLASRATIRRVCKAAGRPLDLPAF
jgi:hypothetical protein